MIFMTVKTKDLLAEALRLDESERASIAGALIESLHPQIRVSSRPGIESSSDGWPSSTRV